MNVSKYKLELLEAEWARRGHLPVPENTVYDTIIPGAISGVAGIIGLDVDTTTNVADYLARAMISEHDNPPDTAVDHYKKELVHGIHHGSDAISGPHHPRTSATSLPRLDECYSDQQVVGSRATKFGIKTAIKRVEGCFEKSTSKRHSYA